jgi:CheY-like chemotaxis protein
MARILLVDDDDLVLSTVQAMLAAAGHSVVPAVDGEDAILEFERRQFDLVICDVIMPNMDGLELVRELRRLSQSIPIISMTGSFLRSTGGAHLNAVYLRLCSELGATKVIAKPFRAHELLPLVEQCLEPGVAPALTNPAVVALEYVNKLAGRRRLS